MIGRRSRLDRPAAWEICAALLRYPDARLHAALPRIAAAADELRGREAAAVAALARGWQQRELLDLQREYVEAFDLDRHAALHVSWHQHGDRRQRGVVLLQLKRAFEEHGFTPAGSELPDWLPMMLEFAARAPEPAGAELLARWHASIELIRRRLTDQGREQRVLLDLVGATLGRPGAPVERAVERLLANGPPEEDVGLEPFGPESEIGLGLMDSELGPDAELAHPAAIGAPR